jgi:hypothetical protein
MTLCSTFGMRSTSVLPRNPSILHKVMRLVVQGCWWCWVVSVVLQLFKYTFINSHGGLGHIQQEVCRAAADDFVQCVLDALNKCVASQPKHAAPSHEAGVGVAFSFCAREAAVMGSCAIHGSSCAGQQLVTLYSRLGWDQPSRCSTTPTCCTKS